MPTLICLHGWGASKESFTELRAALEGSNIEILTPDLPGCGDESEPDRPWSLDDYADWVEKWIDVQTFRRSDDEPFSLLGHSHGGRIAIKLLTRRPTPYALRPTHLFLCASAGIKKKKHVKHAIGLTLSKCGKVLLRVPGLKKLQPLAKKILYKVLGAHDYEQASPIMRETMKNVIQEDLRPLLKHITVQTDIFWGEDDTMTPLKDGQIMHEAISGSRLHSYPGVRHRVHRDRANEIATIIRDSIRAT